MLQRSVFSTFIKIYSPLVMAAIGVILLIVHTRIGAELELIRNDQARQLAAAGRALTAQLEELTADLTYMAEIAGRLTDARRGAAPETTALTEAMRVFIKTHVSYTRVRLLDPFGNEQFLAGALGPPTIAGRTVQAAFGLEPGRFTIAPMPPAGVAVAMPIADADGNRHGVMVVDHDAHALHRAIAGGVLVDDAGVRLLGPSGQTRPPHDDAWLQVIEGSAGQVETRSGLWTFMTVRPEPGGKAGDWKLVFHVTAEDLRQTRRTEMQNGTLLGFGLCLVLMAGCLVAAQIVVKRTADERALRESRDLTASIFEHAVVGLAVLSPEGRWQRVNQALCDILGRSEADLIATDLQSITHPDDLAGDLQWIEKVVAGDGAVYDREKRYRTPDGRPIWCRVMGRLTRDEQGHPQYFIAQIVDISRNRAADDARRLSEERLRAVLAAMPDIGFVFDQDGHYLEILGSGAQSLDLPAVLPIGRTVADVVGGEPGRRCLAAIRETAATGKGHSVEYHLPIGGGERWFEGRTAPLAGTADEQSVILVARDVTDRKQVEADLRLHAHTLAVVPEPIAVFSPDRKVILANPAYAALFGLSCEAMIGQSFEALAEGTASVASILRNFDRCLAGEAFTWDGWRDYPACGLLYVSVIVAPFRQQAGSAVNGIIAVIRDLTERRHEQEMVIQARAAAEAARSRAEIAERRLVDAIECLPLGFSLCDAEARLVIWNHRFAEMMVPTPTPEVCVGIPCGAFPRPEIGAAVDSPLGTLIRAGTESDDPWHALDETGEARFLCRSAAGGWILIHRRRTADGGIVSAFLDVSDLKEKERQLELAAATAVEANRAKSSFLAVMSHELRTPLNGVLGMADLLMTADIPAREKGWATAIVEAGKTLLSLLNSILDLAKIEAGRIEVRTVDFSPRALAEELVTLLQPQAEERDLEVHLVVDADVPACVLGDSELTRQILFNLVGNALKFTEKGHVALTVSVPWRTADQVIVCYEITDTGIGIRAEDRENLFNEFWQADTSFSRRYAGAGLGLAISRRLVELMGGTIVCASQPGLGTVFRVTTPVQALAGALAEGLALSGRRAIALAGDPALAGRLARQLSGLGATDPRAATGIEAVLAWLAEATATGQERPLILIDHAVVAGAAPHLLAASAEIPAPLRPILLRLDRARVPLEPVDGAARDEPSLDGTINLPLLRSTVSAAIRRAPAPRGTSDLTAPPGIPSPESAESVERLTLLNLRAPSILVVDDDEPSRQVMAGMLKEAGCRVEVMAEGQSAIAALATTGFDLVLMDVRMPGMDGLEATRAIRALPGLARTLPIIAVSASAFQQDREACANAGMDGFLSKPIQRGDLFRLIEAWILRSEPGAGAGAGAEIDPGTPAAAEPVL